MPPCRSAAWSDATQLLGWPLVEHHADERVDLFLAVAGLADWRSPESHSAKFGERDARRTAHGRFDPIEDVVDVHLVVSAQPERGILECDVVHDIWRDDVIRR